MTDNLSLAGTLSLGWPLAAGAALGAAFFAGLWWTVRRGLVSERPALWFMGSMLVRTALVLAGFYLVADGRWQRLAACLLGFALARGAVVRRLRPAPARGGEGGHAP